MQKNNKLPSWYKSRIGNWKLRKVKILPQFETYWQQYAYFYLKANKRCEICHKPLRMWYSANISPAKYKHMETANLDHNHKTGEPRGILCKNCNYVMGIVEKRLDGHAVNISDYIKKIKPVIDTYVNKDVKGVKL